MSSRTAEASELCAGIGDIALLDCGLGEPDLDLVEPWTKPQCIPVLEQAENLRFWYMLISDQKVFGKSFGKLSMSSRSLDTWKVLHC